MQLELELCCHCENIYIFLPVTWNHLKLCRNRVWIGYITMKI